MNRVTNYSTNSTKLFSYGKKKKKSFLYTACTKAHLSGSALFLVIFVKVSSWLAYKLSSFTLLKYNFYFVWQGQSFFAKFSGSSSPTIWKLGTWDYYQIWSSEGYICYGNYKFSNSLRLVERVTFVFVD